MKKLFFSLIIISLVVLPLISSYEAVMFSDDFDRPNNSTVCTTCNEFDWNEVTETGSCSLGITNNQLKMTGCVNGKYRLDLNTTNDITKINFMIKDSDNTKRTDLIFKNQNYLTNITMPYSLGEIIGYWSFNASGKKIFPIINDQWYNITIDIDSTNKNFSFYRDGVLNYTRSFFQNDNANKYLFFNAENNAAPTIYLDNLTIYGESPAVDVTFYDEVTGSVVNNVNYSITTNNLISLGSTTTGSFTKAINVGKTIIEYESNGYFKRKYVLNVNQSDLLNLKLYLLNESATDASLITFSVLDEDGALLPNAFVSLQKGFVDGSKRVFRTVEMDDSDSNAEGGLHLQKNVQDYRFYVTYDDNVCLTSEETTIYTNSIVLTCTIGQDVISGWIGAYNMVSNISFNSSTGAFTANYANKLGGVQEVCFNITQISGFSKSLINSSCETGSSGSIVLGIGNTTLGNFEALLTARFSDKSVVINSLSKNINNSASNLGVNGVFYAFMIVVILAMAGLFISPEMAIIFSSGGLVISAFIGLLPLGIGTVIIVLVVAGLLLYTYKRGVSA